MDPRTFTIALAVVVSTVLVLSCVVAFVVRPPVVRAAAVMPLAQMAGFLAAFGILFKFPRKLNPELWQTSVFVALIAGVLSAVAVVVRPRWLRWPVLLLAAAVGGYAVFGHKLDAYWHYMIFIVAGEWLLLLALEPLSAVSAPASAAPTAFVLSAAALAFATLYAVDQNTGQLAALVSAIMGPAALLAFFKRTAPLARAATPFAALMLPALCGIVAFYNPDMHPLPVGLFFWMAAAPLAAMLAYVPWLRRRPWVCFFTVLAVSLVILIPAVVVTVKFAAPLDQPDANW